MQNLALIKLGGSVVTFKDRPVTANAEAIRKISHALRKLPLPLIIVHGGGSFGHYWSMKYDMHTKVARYDPHGVSVVHESMVALNQIIVSSMISASLNPYGMPPSVITTKNRPILSKIKQLYEMTRAGVMPVTFGDVVHAKGKRYSILSGDSLMTILAKVLRPSKVIFATNVDGIFNDMFSRELLNEVTIRQSGKIRFSEGGAADITGGMRRKVTEAFKIASHGMDVLMVNGLRPERIADAVQGLPTLGTMVRGRRR